MALPLLTLSYIFLYAPFGFENNDSGFIAGIAYQIASGLNLYSDIIYIRPPVTPTLHAAIFYWPLSWAPLLFDRILFFVQISVFSWLSANLIGRLSDWPDKWISWTAAAAFMLSAHGFPAMGWHTIDGIFFSILAIYTMWKGSHGSGAYLTLAGIFALLAAGSKQSFYPIIPLLILILAQKKAPRSKYVFFIAPILAIAAIYASSLVEARVLHDFLSSISSQTSLRDLIDAGINSYISDIKSKYSLFVFFPTFVAITCCHIKKINSNSHFVYWILIASLCTTIIAIATFYLKEKQWQHPSATFDALYLATLTSSIVLLFFERKNEVWIWLLAMHAVAWMSSISWGYQTTSLYMAPAVLLIARSAHLRISDRPIHRIAIASIIPALFILFLLSRQYTYSLEGPVERSENLSNLGEISPKFRGIYASEKIYKNYASVKYLADSHKEPFVVLPNMPAAHLMMGQKNPIGLDWPMNAESGEFDIKIQDRLNKNVAYAFVKTTAEPRSNLPDRFGSRATMFVLERWEKINRYGEFEIYRNPNFSSKFTTEITPRTH